MVTINEVCPDWTVRFLHRAEVENKAAKLILEGKYEKAIALFENSEFGTVRTIVVDKEPYFVGKDVANILGYQNGSRDINRHVDEEDRHKVMLFDGNQDKETI